MGTVGAPSAWHLVPDAGRREYPFRKDGGAPAPAAAKPPTPELAEMIRAAVRQELADRKGT